MAVGPVPLKTKDNTGSWWQGEGMELIAHYHTVQLGM